MNMFNQIKKFANKIPMLTWWSQKLSKIKLHLQFSRDYDRFNQLTRANQRFCLKWADRHPCLYDNSVTAKFDRHYVFHLAWAARKVADLKPKVHVDIASSLHFCTILSAFISVQFYDYRQAFLNLSNLTSEEGDIVKLPFADCSVESISCMHVVEHIGLGRYGDPLNPDGDLLAISELKRVLAAGGFLLFVVPIGQPRLMFNAHRIYSYSQIMEYFEGLNLNEFSLIPDNPEDGGLILNADPKLADRQRYGCGCFCFTRSSK